MNAIKEDWLYKAIGEKIRIFRRSKLLNQQELASKAKLSRTSLVNIEQGNQHVSLHHLWRIAVCLDVDLQHLLPSAIEIKEISKNAKTPEKMKPEVSEKLHSFLNLVKHNSNPNTSDEPQETNPN